MQTETISGGEVRSEEEAAMKGLLHTPVFRLQPHSWAAGENVDAARGEYSMLQGTVSLLFPHSPFPQKKGKT